MGGGGGMEGFKRTPWTKTRSARLYMYANAQAIWLSMSMQLVCISKNIWAELSNEFGRSCLINFGRVGMGRDLCGPSWHGPNWSRAELSVIHLTLVLEGGG